MSDRCHRPENLRARPRSMSWPHGVAVSSTDEPARSPTVGDMAARSIPEGYHTITPYFTVSDADRLIDFVTAAFEGHVVKEDRSDNGRVRHARIRIGDSIMMLNEAGGDYSANESQMHLYVSDVDAAFRKALDEGASAVMEPNDRPHGDRMAGLRDPCGNTWWIATPR